MRATGRHPGVALLALGLVIGLVASPLASLASGGPASSFPAAGSPTTEPSPSSASPGLAAATIPASGTTPSPGPNPSSPLAIAAEAESSGGASGLAESYNLSYTAPGYIGTGTGYNVSAIDTGASSETGHAIAYDPQTSEVWSGSTVAAHVYIINDSTNSLYTTLDVGPTGVPVGSMAYDNRSGEMFVAASDDLYAVDGSTLETVATIALSDQTYGACYDFGTNEVFLASGGAGVVVVSAATDSIVTTITAGDGSASVVCTPGLVLSVESNALPTRDRVYAVDDATDSVAWSTLVGQSNELWPRFAYDPAAGEVFEANWYDNNLSIISLAGQDTIGNISGLTGATGPSYDSATGNLLVGSSTGTASVVSATTGYVVANTSARTLTSSVYDTGKGWFYAASGAAYVYAVATGGYREFPVAQLLANVPPEVTPAAVTFVNGTANCGVVCSLSYTCRDGGAGASLAYPRPVNVEFSSFCPDLWLNWTFPGTVNASDAVTFNITRLWTSTQSLAQIWAVAAGTATLTASVPEIGYAGFGANATGNPFCWNVGTSSCNLTLAGFSSVSRDWWVPYPPGNWNLAASTLTSPTFGVAYNSSLYDTLATAFLVGWSGFPTGAANASYAYRFTLAPLNGTAEVDQIVLVLGNVTSGLSGSTASATWTDSFSYSFNGTFYLEGSFLADASNVTLTANGAPVPSQYLVVSNTTLIVIAGAVPVGVGSAVEFVASYGTNSLYDFFNAVIVIEGYAVTVFTLIAAGAVVAAAVVAYLAIRNGSVRPRRSPGEEEPTGRAISGIVLSALFVALLLGVR